MNRNRNVHIRTKPSAEAEIPNIAGTETEIAIPVQISVETGTELNFGRSLLETAKIDDLFTE